MTIIDGKRTADAIRSELRQEVERLVAGGQRPPHLAVVIVGHEPASETYVNNKPYITPVPGGVEPMTIASLLQNTLQAYNTHKTTDYGHS